MRPRTFRVMLYEPWHITRRRVDGPDGERWEALPPEEQRWVAGFKPVRMDLSLRELLDALVTFVRYPAKERAWSWSPVDLSEPYRKSVNVREMTCIVADLDSGGRTLEDQVAPVVAKGWLHAVHSSWSYTDEKQKGRVVLPLAAPVPAEYIPRAWRWMQQVMGGAADEQCKDLARLYFLPGHDGTPEHAGRMRAWVGEGDLLDLRPFDDLPVIEAPPPPVVHRPVTVYSHDDADREVRRRLAQDPTVRRRAANELGARIVTSAGREKAKGIRCPSCGRASVWFYIEGNTAQGARCEHEKSCKWSGLLLDLLR